MNPLSHVEMELYQFSTDLLLLKIQEINVCIYQPSR